jgi:hypothetical protein
MRRKMGTDLESAVAGFWRDPAHESPGAVILLSPSHLSHLMSGGLPNYARGSAGCLIFLYAGDLYRITGACIGRRSWQNAGHTLDQSRVP